MIPGVAALLVWTLIPPILFYLLRPHVAAALTFLSAVMFLPVGVAFNPPALPEIDKEGLSSILALGCAVAFAGGLVRRSRPLRGPEILIAVLAVAGVFTRLGNTDTIHYGAVSVPGVELTSIPAQAIGDVLVWGIPFFIGRALFVRSEHLRDLFFIMIFAGLVYSLFILIEVRLSPQMHRWTYGYHQHGFYQTIRESGYRPMVFMRHGLHVSLFACLCMAAAFGATRMRASIPLLPFMPKIAVAGYLAFILVICKSLGSLFYGLLIGPLIALASPRMQMRAAVAIAALTLIYPAVRASQLIPVAPIIELVEEEFGHKRARSLSGRLNNEEQMMPRIRERLWLGWANSGRPMLRDPHTGRVVTTYDGVWVLTLVKGGVFRFVGIFGLLLCPVFMAFARLSKIRSREDQVLVSALALMVSINAVDLLPNSTTEGYLTLLSGVLAGVVPGILREQREARSARPAEVEPGALHEQEVPVVRPGDEGGGPSNQAGGAGLSAGLLGRPDGPPSSPRSRARRARGSARNGESER